MSRFRKVTLEFKHPFFLIGVILTVVEYSIYLAGLDYLIRVSFLVTHHFFEMGGMLFWGLWIGRIEKLYLKRMYVLGQLFPWMVFLVATTTEILMKGVSFALLIVAFFLYTPLLIGFYIYLAFGSRQT